MSICPVPTESSERINGAQSLLEKYRFDKLAIGGKAVTIREDTPERNNQARKAALNFAMHHGLRFTTRAVQGGFKVWRIE